jgi:Protein of unknown function (DUF2914)/Tetratricopeptide repeat
MPDTRNPQTVIEAAEQAANTGDFAAAERLLLKAAELQEASLGSAHPDLSNTHNNLGVVYEITGKLEEAERSFRRAYAIAALAFPADHPFVATSRKNLEDFCAEHGLAVAPSAAVPGRSVVADPAVVAPVPAVARTPPPPARVEAPKPASVVTTSIHTATSEMARPAEPTTQPSPRVAVDARSHDDFKDPPRSIAWRPAGAFALLLAAMVIGLWYRGRDAASPSVPTQESQPTAPATPSLSPSGPAVKPAEPTAVMLDPPVRARPQPETGPASGAVRKDAPIVVEASVCHNLVTSGNWRCEPPASPAAAGPLVFYTRVKSDRATTVQHRWYRGNQLLKSSSLTIAANPGRGYRTYSRYTVRSSGDWRVELRSADGAVLREERFTVR